MHQTVLTVFAVTALLGLVSLLLPLAERFAISYTVLLALVGIAIGAVTNIPAAYNAGGIVGDILGTLRDFGLSAELLLYIFLPALLFEAALNVDVRQLGDELAPVLLLAVVGVVVCTFVVGLALWPISPVGVVACIVLGAIIATTDPVAVVAIFRDIGAPRRLSTLVQGESLFNDAAAIAVYSLAVAMLTGDRPASPLDGVLAFLRQFGGGLAVGYLAGWLVTLCMPILRSSRLAEATLTIGFAYFIFIVCDHYLGFSGVVAVATAALAVSAGGRRRMSPSNFESLAVSWEQLAFWASSLIFLFAAMKTPELLLRATWRDIALLGALIAAALVARALTLYGLIPILSFARIARPIDAGYKIVMLWGGMRGAVSLALALAATEETSLPPEIRQFVGVLATGFVLFTLLVTAPTMRPLMRFLKLSKVPPAEMALRERVIGLSLSSIRQEIEKVGRRAPDPPGARRRGRRLLRRAQPRPRRHRRGERPAARPIADPGGDRGAGRSRAGILPRLFRGAHRLAARRRRLAHAYRTPARRRPHATASKVIRRRRHGCAGSARPSAWRWRCTGGWASRRRSPASSPTGSRCNWLPASSWKT